MTNYGGFPYSFPLYFGAGDGEVAEVGDMFLSDFEEELVFNLIQENPRLRTRTIKNYYTPQSDYPSTIKEEMGAKELAFSGFFDYSIGESKHIRERKLDYFLSSNNKLLLINIPRDYATFFNLKNIGDVDDASFRDIDTFYMRGDAENQPLGQIRLAIDSRCSTDGTKVGDTTAMQNRAVQLDTLNEYVSFNLTQDNLKLPIGNYEFIVRAKAEQADTMKMEVLNSDDTDEWSNVYSAGAVNVLCLKAFKEKLYAGTSDGKIYVSENGTDFSLAFNTGETEVHCLEEYEDALYVGTGNNGKIFKYDEAAWTLDYNSGLINAHAFAKIWGNLYVAGNIVTPSGAIYELADGSWSLFYGAPVATVTTYYALEAYNNYLWVGGTNNAAEGRIWYVDSGANATLDSGVLGGAVYAIQSYGTEQYCGVDNGKIYQRVGGIWSEDYDTGEVAVRSLFLLGGIVYAGTGNNGKLYGCPGAECDWSLYKDLSDTSIHSGELFDNQGFIGTGASGNIYAYQNGVIASEQKSLTTTYVMYKLPFSITNLDEGDTVQFKVTKDGSVAAWVNTDFLCFVATR